MGLPVLNEGVFHDAEKGADSGVHIHLLLHLAREGLAARIRDCVRAQALPTDTRLSHDVLYEFATHDKKGQANTTNVVVARDLGDVGIMTVTHEDLRRIIDLGCGTEA